MSDQLRSLRHERDVREHGDAVTTRPWWNAPGEESRVLVPMRAEHMPELILSGINNRNRKPIRILANPRPFT